MPPRPLRRAGGEAGGALSGFFPDVGMGLPPLMGFSLWDDFIIAPRSSLYGDLAWPLYSIGGVPTVTAVACLSHDEAGIARLSTGITSAFEGGIITNDDGQPTMFGPSVNMLYVCRVRLVDSTEIVVWSGFLEAIAGFSDGTSNSGIGVRFNSDTDTNWMGVCRHGGSETTIDLGLAADTTFNGWAGFQRVGANEVEFYTWNMTRRGLLERTTIGSIDSNIPTDATNPVPLAVVTRDGNAKAAEIDAMGIGGRIAR